MFLLGAMAAAAFMTPPARIPTLAPRHTAAPASTTASVPPRCRNWNLRAPSLRSSMRSTAVVPLQSETDLDSALGAKRLVFVELYGSRCRKCFSVMGKFNLLAEQHTQPETVAFTQIACDKVTNVAERVGVRKVPTFQVYLDGEKVDELVGLEAVPVVTKKIRQLVKEWVDLVSAEQRRVQASEAQRVIDEYNAPDGSAQPKEGADCGPEGCEIVWD
eukprot:CAMPEP_0196757684 /NCGR_PEP_ID=MMETSP1091-20130531/103792_1 /TAXON_ID=302021 /ORGANISM="Rhodomonas sp., Strain CCMP768" /LENGTH=216 /DNA_ID=CAMNT_0042106471 /DNA_START=568 /DNA_END=1218 /DNA_ORIENTATION=-